MNSSKWGQLVYLAEEKFGIDRQDNKEIIIDETHKGQEIKGEKEIIEFQAPIGKIRMEKITKPKVIDKKINSSKRAGSKTTVDLVYSDTETVSSMNLYKKDSSGEWKEIKPEDLNN